ncbi:probable methyltransferase PMT28 [Zingiber officinale]|uniref:probable methyltransferase PMT28 n=1 Tax=Zingiber officinale TaxID=94328 RepID=UPI001C4C3B90|nr:probable methyltransferase PMT28 [Zingiber officinale]
MVSARLGRSIKRPPLGFGVKVSLVFLLGLAFIVIWWAFSSPSASVVSLERNSFGEIEAPPATTAAKKKNKETQKKTHRNKTPIPSHKDDNLKKSEDRSRKEKNKEREKVGGEIEQAVVAKNETSELVEEAEDDEKVEVEGLEEVADNENMTDEDMQDDGDENTEGVGGGDEASNSKAKKKKKLGPLFDPKVRYTWKLCGQKTGQNYIPCVDMEGGHRHHKRSCPRTPLMCLVSLPKDYRSPEPWPGRESKIWFSNLEHPKLSAFIKTQNWLNLSSDYLLIPPKASEFKGGAEQYFSSIEEMVPDIEWGKNIRVILDIGCTGGGFGVALLEKNVITLSFGLMGDQTDLAQLTLERGIPAVLGNLASRRLPFPSSVFDAIHCGECGIPWHSSGGKLLLEMNRILRPGGYFITSTKNGDIDSEEGMSTLIASICWSNLGHKTDEDSETNIRVYQRPTSNDIYELRATKKPSFCQENENQDAAWYTPIKPCLHKVAAAIEERGTDWPEEWPKRLDTFPEWLADSHDKLTADHKHWKAVVDKSYLGGLGIDWSTIRNVMDMKAIYGGFAAALASQKVWVMNVVPVHAPNTLPIIFERGLLGIYHDWCEPFSTYPRSYDLLHADHLFSRLKNRCKQPVVIVVEMDRILRPGGWVIIRDKLEILDPLEAILRSLYWDIRTTYGKDKEGLICAQKTTWRP